MVEGGMKCVKYLLFAFNLIFFLAGLALIIAGAVVQAKLSAYVDMFGSTFSAAAVLLIVVGAVIFVIGFFGCCGAYKENYCMTMTFAVLLGLIFFLEIAAGIAAYALRNKVEGVVDKALHKSMQNWDKAGTRSAWNLVQQEFKCCGVKTYTDWKNSTFPVKKDNVPDSCCDKSKVKNGTAAGCGKGQQSATKPTQIYTKGCLDGFEGWIKQNIVIVGGVGIGLAFVQLMGVILACCLARTIRKEYTVV